MSIVEKIKLDAAGKSLGRFATEVAVIIRGKNDPHFAPNKIPSRQIIISNIDKIKIAERKLDANKRRWITKYPGGLKQRPWREDFAKNPQKFFLTTIKQMLPHNNSRTTLLKSILFE